MSDLGIDVPPPARGLGGARGGIAGLGRGVDNRPESLAFAQAVPVRHAGRTGAILAVAILALLGGVAVLGAQRLAVTPATSGAAPAPAEMTPAGVGALGWVEPASRIRHLGPPGNLAVNRVERLLVHEGDQVAAGQLLAEFADVPVKDAAVATAAAKVAEAEAALALVKAAGRPSQVEAQEARIASLAARESIATRDAARSAALVPSGSAARAVAERDRAAADRAAADLHEATAQLATLQEARPEDVALADARLQTARALLASARADAALSRIYAPIAGRILKIHARPGDLIGPDGLLDLADLDSLQVVADVYQTDLQRVRLDAPARVSIPADTETYTARVVRIGSLVRNTTEAGMDPVAKVDARTVEVRLALTPEAARKLAGRIGMQVQVAIDP